MKNLSAVRSVVSGMQSADVLYPGILNVIIELFKCYLISQGGHHDKLRQ